MQSITDNDTDGWNAFRNGDSEALMCLYRQHLSALYNYGYNLARDRSLVEDAIQDVFLYIHQHRDGLGTVQNVRAYLMQSLRHRVLYLLKQDDFKTVGFSENLSETNAFLIDTTQEPAWVQDEANAERNRRLNYLLNGLPKRQREALYLIYFQQLSYAEAADIMQVDVKSVYNFVFKALTAIRQTAGVADWLLTPAVLWLLAKIFENSST